MNSTPKSWGKLPVPVQSGMGDPPTGGAATGTIASFAQHAGVIMGVPLQLPAPLIPQRRSSASQFEPGPTPLSNDLHHLRKLRQQLAEMKQELKTAQDLIKSLETEIKQYDDVCLQRDVENHELRSALVALRGSANYHLDDGAVQSRLKAIKFMIEQIIGIRYATGAEPFVRERHSFTKKPFALLVKDLDRYLLDPLKRAFLLEAFVWNTLIATVFSRNGMLWGGTMVSHVQQLSRDFENDTIELTDFHKWYAQTASILYSMYGLDTRRIEKIADGLRTALRPWQSTTFTEGQCDMFEDLVQLAAELDADFSRSRADYMIFMLETDEGERRLGKFKYGVPFDADYMELQGGNSDSSGPVELVISPTVVKVGGSDGDNYDYSTVLMRAKVMCASSNIGHKHQRGSNASNASTLSRYDETMEFI
ncbi:hypothetical protein QBC40DRAFT_88014 [Triangularia verruculosa]|uniref:Uncharacterized protein n=1 Tax=Triangularia verruculosa TaxID=2587418 RepID=A0AAN7AVH7_9PEZI|nr:hypothetical protein QBC40DRAFT_88014 [Triangularia verruculosa]